jgi:hypothetical protein
VHDADGTIRCYRDGELYGKPYLSSGLMTFPAGSSHVVFGMRHSPAGGNKMLKGRILQAQLYDRALSAEEISAVALAAPGYVSDTQVLAAFTNEQRSEHARLAKEVTEFEQRLQSYEPLDQWRPDPIRRWQDLAHALFNFKEFIYLR